MDNLDPSKALPSDALLATTFASIFVVMLAFNGCMERSNRIDARLQPAVTDFQRTFGIHVQSTIQVMPDDIFVGNQIAYCRRTLVGPNKLEATLINVSNRAVTTLTPEGIAQVMYHELAHCELGLSHESYVQLDLATAQGRTCPTSVLVPMHFSDECWTNYYNYYVTQLKNRYQRENLTKVGKVGSAPDSLSVTQ